MRIFRYEHHQDHQSLLSYVDNGQYEPSSYSKVMGYSLLDQISLDLFLKEVKKNFTFNYCLIFFQGTSLFFL